MIRKRRKRKLKKIEKSDFDACEKVDEKGFRGFMRRSFLYFCKFNEKIFRFSEKVFLFWLASDIDAKFERALPSSAVKFSMFLLEIPELFTEIGDFPLIGSRKKNLL